MSDSHRSSNPRPKAYSYIRMSTGRQLKGDSKRRQEEKSRQYAEAHNLELVEGPELHDIGVSAFTGANVKGDGALGRFLAAIEDGRIEPGSYLLMESLDRLSRQEIIKSVSVFIDILESGVKLVTLADEQVYEQGAGFEQILFSLVILSRAFEEGKMKSERVAQAWENKRQLAVDTGKIITRKVPAWLQVNEDGDGFDVLDGRVAVIEKIFDLCACGMGNLVIAKTLNDDGVAPFGNSKQWNPNSVGKILGNRAVLGEYQPKQSVDGKQVDAGEVIKDYFPAILDEDQFNRCQAIRAERQTYGGGRKGTNVANLFSKLAKCGYCGGKMHFYNKGGRTKKGKQTYLICENKRSGKTCSARAWRYVDFETSFLSFIAELDFSSLETSKGKGSKFRQLTQQKQSLSGKIKRLRSDMEKTHELYLKNPDSDFVGQKLFTYESELSDLEKQFEPP